LEVISTKVDKCTTNSGNQEGRVLVTRMDSGNQEGFWYLERILASRKDSGNQRGFW